MSETQIFKHEHVLVLYIALPMEECDINDLIQYIYIYSGFHFYRLKTIEGGLLAVTRHS